MNFDGTEERVVVFFRTFRCIIFCALVASTATAARADDDGWRMPHGWTEQSPVRSTMIVLWAGPFAGGFTPNIGVLWDKVHPVNDQEKAMLDQFRTLHVDPNVRVVRCAQGEGRRLDYRRTVGTRSLDVVSYLIPDGTGGAYIASYMRAARTPAVSDVVASLTGICEKYR